MSVGHVPQAYVEELIDVSNTLPNARICQYGRFSRKPCSFFASLALLLSLVLIFLALVTIFCNRDNETALPSADTTLRTRYTTQLWTGFLIAFLSGMQVKATPLQPRIPLQDQRRSAGEKNKNKKTNKKKLYYTLLFIKCTSGVGEGGQLPPPPKLSGVFHIPTNQLPPNQLTWDHR